MERDSTYSSRTRRDRLESEMLQKLEEVDGVPVASCRQRIVVL